MTFVSELLLLARAKRDGCDRFSLSVDLKAA